MFSVLERSSFVGWWKFGLTVLGRGGKGQPLLAPKDSWEYVGS